MKNLFTISALAIGISTASVAQPLQVNPAQLNFGTTNELTTDSLQLTITNPHSFAVQITGVKFFDTYRRPAFSVAQQVFSVPAGGNKQVWVRFHPEHNIAHNSEMVLVTDSKLGSLSVDLTGQGTYSNAYYSTSQNQKEEALKQALKTKISTGYNSLGYNTARDRMFMTIDNKKTNGQGATENTLECIYTGRLAVGYTSRTDAQSNDNFNTEHTFPQGFFNQAEPMRSDLHHLFPTDENANNSRGNMPFGIATQPYIAENINFPSHRGTNGYYEPRDQQKGRTARAMLYFVVRYQDYSNFISIQQPALKDWNYTFAPQLEEKTRNNTIALPTNQNNRNPFVDYPQFADRITNFSSTSSEASVFALYSSDSVISFGQPVVSQPVYRYVLVNHGNQAVTLSNFTLSNTSNFSFAAGNGNTTLQPGEAQEIDIELTLTPGDSAQGLLTYNTSIAAMATVQVPLIANAQVVAVDKPLLDLYLSVYPNPAQGKVTVEPGVAAGEQFSVQVYNVNGQLVKKQVQQQNKAEITTSDLAPGVYIVRVQCKSGLGMQRFVKLN